MRIVLLLLLLAVPLSAQTMQRDSAGIRIVVNPDPASVPFRFVIDTLPIVTIGDSPAQWLPPTVGAVPLPNNAIAVALRDAEVRVYDSTGRYVRSIGRRGVGPGELGQISFIARSRGDTLLIADPNRLRLTAMTAAGVFVSSLGQVSGPRSCCLPNGSWLTVAPAPGVVSEPGTGRRRLVVLAARGDDANRVVDTLVQRWGPDPAISVPMNLPPRTVGRATVGGVLSIAPPFGRMLTVRAFQGGFVVGDGGAADVHVHDATGRHTGIIRILAPPRAVTSALKERYIAEFRQNAAGMSRDIGTDALRKQRFPERVPTYRDLQVDELGRLWMQNYPLPGDPESTWVVFSPQGTLLGRARIPRDHVVHAIGSDRILTITRDGDDGFRVHVLRYREIAPR